MKRSGSSKQISLLDPLSRALTAHDHDPRKAAAARPPPGGHSPASHAGAMRRAVLNPVRNTCFVTGCNA
eukprot:2934587-Prymnesium_polylepis.1